MSNKIISWAKSKIKPYLLSLVKYYDGQLYELRLDHEQKIALFPCDSSASIKLLILARKHYQESVDSIPVDNNKELKKILALKYPNKLHTKYSLCNQDNGQSKVNVWHLDPNVPSALFTIPETAIFSHQIENNQLLTINKKQTSLFVSRTNNVVYSSVQSALVKNPAMFALSAGIMPDSEEIIGAEQFATRFSLPFKQMPFSRLISFIKPSDTLLSKEKIKWLGLPLAAIFLLNLLVVSAFISYKKNELETSMAQFDDKFTTMLSAQQEMEENLQRFDALSSFFSTQSSHLDLLLAVSDVFPKARISNLRRTDGRYILRGYTENALDLLTFMNNHERIEDAKFDFPINKGGKIEFFVISFKSVALANLVLDTNEQEGTNNG
ncbi:hypothetical protein [Thalassotalea piscium]|uniref:Fimbrial assembly protein n=1 Tax=Thalassotalea piscium TaxID=1230533 RepID=A0A7X0NG02_9GAMM|nr:hypothetical protein [Thalassotalea piscium]MBB6542763.1 hypothetical protein [Thalassotalea piscium]